MGLTTPFRLAWLPIAAFLRLLGFGAGVGPGSWRPPVEDSRYHLWQEIQARRESTADRAAVPRRTPPPAAPGRRTGKRGLALVAVIATLVAAVGALAYFSGSGFGFASAVVGATSPVTISPGTATTGLYPGGSADVAVSISNPNSTAVHLSSLVLDTSQGTGGFAVDGTDPGCNLGSLSFNGPQTDSGGDFVVPANGTLARDLSGAVSMDVTAVNACQGLTFKVFLKAGP
jgi:hypothetical protein